MFMWSQHLQVFVVVGQTMTGDFHITVCFCFVQVIFAKYSVYNYIWEISCHISSKTGISYLVCLKTEMSCQVI